MKTMTEPEVVARIEQIKHLPLSEGSHKSLEQGMCVMEAVSYVAGEPFTDAPECACPVVATFMRTWNDDLPLYKRQDLKAYIPLLIGSRGDLKLAERRALMAADWLLRVAAPEWLRLAGMSEHADALCCLPEVTSAEDALSYRSAIEAARDAALYAVRDHESDELWHGACNAVGVSACAAALCTANGLLRDHMMAIALDAARSAAMVAAIGNGGDYACEILTPTVNKLYRSAHVLVRRMLEVM